MVLNKFLQKTTMYELALTQVLAARAINETRQSLLKAHGLSSAAEWFVLGIVHANRPGGIRVTDLAHRMGVNTPYITAVLNGLKDKDYVCPQADEHDARVRLIVTTPKGNKEIRLIEDSIRTMLEKKLQGKVKPAHLEGYTRVIETMAKTELDIS